MSLEEKQERNWYSDWRRHRQTKCNLAPDSIGFVKADQMLNKRLKKCSSKYIGMLMSSHCKVPEKRLIVSCEGRDALERCVATLRALKYAEDL